jgi:hypothetical protein
MLLNALITNGVVDVFSNGFSPFPDSHDHFRKLFLKKYRVISSKIKKNATKIFHCHGAKPALVLAAAAGSNNESR